MRQKKIKICVYCKKPFFKKKTTCKNKWKDRKYCSKSCALRDRKISEKELFRLQTINKGRIPWNKGNKKKYFCDICGGELVNSRAKICKKCNRGKNNHLWRNGKSKGKRTGRKYKQWRSDVFKRDNWTCQTCGARGCYLEAHHIKSWAEFPKLRYDLENGVALCKECHKLTDNYKGKNRYAFSRDDSNNQNQEPQEEN